MSDTLTHSERIEAGLTKRYRAEKRFRLYGIAAIAVAMAFLVIMLAAIGIRGIGAFQQTEVALTVVFDETHIKDNNWQAIVKESMRKKFPEVTSRSDKRLLTQLMSSGAGFNLQNMYRADPSLVGETRTVWLTASDDVDMLMKGAIDRASPQSERRVSDKEIVWIDSLIADGALELKFNTHFFTGGDSREPELAGIFGAFMGSIFSLAVCFLLSFPLGVMTAIYLEEFAPKNRWTDVIEVNINNLAAVPSIVFGLLGLAVFLNFFMLPRSAPLVGGMVLALMTLPTIIIASRAALRAVPPSIREAAWGMGASSVQTVLHHVLPLAMPGMLTGTIIGMAQALGESAPLLMIGMVAFIVDIPGSFTDPATALPVQIFLWADSPERAFTERTAAAIIVLLVFLVTMNLIAVVLRKKFERRW
ncbi:phosphate ABC transporter permease PstA [Magnetovibrio blakemorei]|uniref:Phosphate transport system permease protein PstA n=1 Tax=Magnetovibrio blakemorei TaxID=28181 RepID=A0A1E5Q895_9PROT|nr:phosphate ABC transporter permease PstA [Magnetovibrio blakemorei]OEJ67575.1 phosphate ABC transporter, permease protein PstA [Magnetovibrio blakemorei]